MHKFCKNHPLKEAISFCHNCGNYYCKDCLNEGKEFYYCNNEDCYKKYAEEAEPEVAVADKLSIINCPNCKTKLLSEVKFCPNCGIDLSILSMPVPSSICKNCNEKNLHSAKFCIKCGVKLNNNEEVSSIKDSDILIELRKYQKHIELKCLECGYKGLMGIESQKFPWYFSNFFLVVLVLTGIGIVGAIALGWARSQSAKYIVKCPSCKKLLQTN